jgi:hypothetical protein
MARRKSTAGNKTDQVEEGTIVLKGGDIKVSTCFVEEGTTQARVEYKAYSTSISVH